MDRLKLVVRINGAAPPGRSKDTGPAHSRNPSIRNEIGGACHVSLWQETIAPVRENPPFPYYFNAAEISDFRNRLRTSALNSFQIFAE